MESLHVNNATFLQKAKTADLRDAKLEWLLGQLKRLTARQFYGKITLHFEAGELQRMLKEESVKPTI